MSNTTNLIQILLLDEELNRSIVNDNVLGRALQVESKIRDVLHKSISKQEAFDLFETYTEIINEIHEVEKEHWLKTGIRMGYEFHEIINQPSH